MARTKKSLTVRESDVLRMIENGNAVEQIAESLGITRSGVYAHIRKLKDKGHLHPDQKVAGKAVGSNGTAVSTPVEWQAPVEFTGTTASSTSGMNGHGYEVAFDALIKAGAAERALVETLSEEIEQSERELAEMRSELERRNARADALQQAGKTLDVELVDKSAFEPVTA